MYVYTQWQPLFDEMERSIPNMMFHKGIPTRQVINEWYAEYCSAKLLILDDVIRDAPDSSEMLQLIHITVT